MKTIRLHGELAKRFGREHRFDVKNPAEAFRALCSQVRGFRTYLHEHMSDKVAVFTGKSNIGSEQLDCSTSESVIRIVPVIEGAGGSGRSWALIVIGAILVAPSFGTNPTGWQMIGMGIGMSLISAGVGGLLTPKPPGPPTVEEIDPKDGYAFGGAVNTTREGNPVPICYGKLIVGSQMISLGLNTY